MGRGGEPSEAKKAAKRQRTVDVGVIGDVKVLDLEDNGRIFETELRAEDNVVTVINIIACKHISDINRSAGLCGIPCNGR